MKIICFLTMLPLLALAAPAAAQMENFKPGPVFETFGPTAPVQQSEPVSAEAQFAIAFDGATAADTDKINRTIESAARFINMHVAAGVPKENIRLAIVVHGGASVDLTRQEFFAAKKDGKTNASAAAIARLQQHGVQFYLCGQSAAAHGISNADLLPGVKMSLSAMTAHALLQQQGYSINPF
ncbi:DsrE family protein [Sphingorhabdus sp. SMR4y]|uniref:DsrE family protein n=1 Tax=Sphingorhabdus sp. SMR4y TaxID=2584094 RepID=UPI000B5F70C6|nr:DsrE family protein [Sphingorhabdus sp. SMR4y]ASK87049.1 DsrE/DsrF-like family protein [Sphingorhabdus sp. SMR4y]